MCVHGEMHGWETLLISSSCYNNTIDCVANKQKFISHNYRGWEVQNQGTDRFVVWEEPASWVIDSCLFTVSSQGGRDGRTLWHLFY